MMVTTLLLVCGAMSITWICDTISESGFGIGLGVLVAYIVLVYCNSSQLHILAKIRSLILFFLFRCNCCISGQGSSLIICVGILTGYTEMLYNMLSRLSGM